MTTINVTETGDFHDSGEKLIGPGTLSDKPMFEHIAGGMCAVTQSYYKSRFQPVAHAHGLVVVELP